MAVAELQELDAGGWFGVAFAGQRIPTLQQVFDAVGHRLVINVEIKIEVDHHPLAQEAETVRLIEDNNLVGRVIVSSFSAKSLRRVHRLNPHIPLGLLYARVETRFSAWIARLLHVPYQALHPSFRMVDAAYVEKAHRQGYRVNVWTVNEVDDMRRMLDAGVDAIITNYPDVLSDLLSERQDRGQ